MEKKISFGFSKVSKKSNLLINKLVQQDDKDKIELIKCLEGQAIQLVEKKEEEAPLVIPLKDGGKTSAALLSLRRRQAVLNDEVIPDAEEKEQTNELPVEPNGNTVEDIEKRAARELLAEINKGDEDDGTSTALVLPVKVDDLPLDGAKESTIDDYESIPITQFGKAMLRGMGWKELPKKKGAPIEDGPVLRPKGMGLGADKAIKKKALLIPPEANEILETKKGACIRVLGGKHKDLYGTIEGLDEHAGRVIVKMALGNVTESFNEFMVQPVSKKEFAEYSKCINSAKYDQYKRVENEHIQINPKKENTMIDYDHQPEESHRLKAKNEKDFPKHNRQIDEDDRPSISARRNSPDRRSRSREKRGDRYVVSSTSHKKYSSRHRSKSDDSQSSSDSSTYRSKHKKSSKSKKSKKRKDKKHERRHSSEGSSGDERRHKKKTKKSKRGRSRSRSKGRRQ